MKQTTILLAGGGVLLALSWAGWRRMRSPPITPRPPAAISAAPDGSTLASGSDPVTVFQKAFWRRPGSGDRILHAERREWSTASDGVKRWQWFIACRPGPPMAEWLATNPFSLSSPAAAKDSGVLTTVSAVGPLPDWFPSDITGYQLRKSGSGTLVWILGEDGALLYATDSGSGFSPGSPVR